MYINKVKVGEGRPEPTDYATASIIVIYREGWKEGRKERIAACHKSHPRPLSPRKPLLSLCIFPSSHLRCTFHLFRQLRFPSTQSHHARLSLLRVFNQPSFRLKRNRKRKREKRNNISLDISFACISITRFIFFFFLSFSLIRSNRYRNYFFFN